MKTTFRLSGWILAATALCSATAQQPPAPAPAPATPAAATLSQEALLQAINAINGVGDGQAADPNGGKKAAAPTSGNTGQLEGPTVITAVDSQYNQSEHLALFEKEVVVNNATFNLVCDKLTAYLKHGNTPAAPVGPEPKGAAGKANVPDNSGLERAIAEGAVEITQDKVDDNGNITHSVGRAKKTIYEAATGKFTLIGNPELQQGDNVCVATDERTTIVLKRDGHMEAFGPHKMLLKEAQDEKPK